MKLIGLVPARGGSKGIPRKNVRLLGGRPLIAWTIEAALASGALDRVVVSTDDEEIAQVAREAGAEVPFLRPADLANDQAPALPVMRHALDALDREGLSGDAVVYLQPTSPFRGARAIAQAASLISGGTCDTVVSVMRVPHAMTPESLMVQKGEYLDFMAPPEARSFRRQDKSVLYARNGPAILALARETVMANALYGERILPLELGTLESCDIDEEIDLRMAEHLVPLVLSERAAGRI